MLEERTLVRNEPFRGWYLDEVDEWNSLWFEDSKYQLASEGAHLRRKAVAILDRIRARIKENNEAVGSSL